MAASGNTSPGIPLRYNFRYFHEPLTDERYTDWIVGRESDARVLANRLMYSRGGSFLVTGFRGVGKTTFVHHAMHLIRFDKKTYTAIVGDFDLLDVWINLGRPIKPTELMHLIIRHLCLRLKESGLESGLDPELRKDLSTAFLRTSFEISSTRLESEERTREESFGYKPALLLGLEFFGKLGSKYKKATSDEEALKYLPYDDRAAEFDIHSFGKRLATYVPETKSLFRRLVRFLTRHKPASKNIKVVFIFDELDKLAGSSDKLSRDILETLLRSLKSVFTATDFSYVFVAGKEVYERWAQDVALGDSIYESIFAYDLYLPCLWDEQQRFILNCLDSKPADDARLFNLISYLQYKGRGVLRRMVRELNTYVVWSGKQPHVVIDRVRDRSITVFSKLQQIVSQNALLYGDESELLERVRLDRQRLRLYYTLDWIVGTRGEPFGSTEVQTAVAKLKVVPPMDAIKSREFVDAVLEMLLKRAFIEPVSENLTVINVKAPEIQQRYRLCDWVLLASEGVDSDVHEDGSSIPRDSAAGVNEQQYTVLRPGELIGNYRVIDLVGQGGMGVVYRASSPTGSTFAVKVLNPRHWRVAAANLKRHFEAEVQTLRTLYHPDIVQVVDYDIGNGQPYIVMEYVDGESLAVVLQSLKRLDQNYAITVVRRAAEAFQYVHEQGIVGNDIKPSNILLSKRGDVKLVDFGFSALMGERHNTDVIVGTPRYLSPEHLSGKPFTPQTDVFGIGIVLYELLTGQNPFEGNDTAEVMYRVLNQDPIPPSQLASVKSKLDPIVLRCLAKEPNRRFSSMQELAKELKHLEKPVELTDLLVKSKKAGEVVTVVRKSETKVISPAQAAQLLHAIDAYKAEDPKASQEYNVREGLAIESVTKDDVEERVSAIRNSASRGVEAIPSLLTQLNHADMRIRLTSFWCLADLNPPHVFDLLFDFALNICFFTNPDKAKISMTRTRLTLGRIPDSDLYLARPELSRRHVMFLIDHTSVSVEDLGSANGLRIAGKSLSHADLKNGDVLEIAGLSIRIHIHTSIVSI